MSSSSTTTSSSSSSATASSSGGPVQGAAQLGLPCTSDATCGPLTCLETANLGINGTAPQGGLCTKTCNSNADCPSGGICADFGAKSYCTQTCTDGSNVPAAQKCRGRHDMACAALNGGGGSACFPTCTSNEGCGSGLYCNYGTGFCQPLPLKGDPMGKACDPKALNTCAGFCLCNDANCTTGYCSGLCTIGQYQSCGEKEGTGLCFLQFASDAGTGDLGACVGDCQCDGDCAPGLVCNGFVEAQNVGFNGVCYDDLGGPTYPTCCSCEGKICGNDGCGTSCGSCPGTEKCAVAGTCCTSCTGKDCGPDGCGGSCGTCPSGQTCTAQGFCQCIPDCTGKVCGSDGCGGTCGSCPGGQVCDAGACCTPSCNGKVCGSNGCGGTCGNCASNEICNAQGQCQCQPSCVGKTCGSDGCGGSCGNCTAGKVCNGGTCCTPNCNGKNCGSDGCGGSCGNCNGTCNNGVCCVQKEPCLFDSDCCGQHCGFYTHVCYECLPLGEVCASNADCCSEACDGICMTCLNPARTCQKNSQCCSGVCNTLGWCN
ncbi:hypothetical protein A7982_12530 [Minicystis rosea]|nr:hypothetical protein A7982_12530 [Minicystis rosea]